MHAVHCSFPHLEQSPDFVVVVVVPRKRDGGLSVPMSWCMHFVAPLPFVLVPRVVGVIQA